MPVFHSYFIKNNTFRSTSSVPRYMPAYPKSGLDRFLPHPSQTPLCQHTVTSALHTTSFNSSKVSKWIEDTVYGVESIYVPQ